MQTLQGAWFLPLEGPPRTTRNEVTTLWREAARGHLHNCWGDGTRPLAPLVQGSGTRTPADGGGRAENDWGPGAGEGPPAIDFYSSTEGDPLILPR